MNCSQEMVEAYLDEELDAAVRASVEQHVEKCPECADAIARLRQQKADIKGLAGYYGAPPDLRNEIRKALRHEARPHAVLWRSWALAASVLLAISAGWNIAEFRRADTAGPNLTDTVVADHIRSLLGTHLLDVPSTDQHTVKPWFAGKLDFSPDVKNLDASGFPLIGGRVDYLAGHHAAALVYQRRQHVINLFIWPEASSSADLRTSHNGYNVLRWADHGMTYWAVSDVSATELDNFRMLYR